MSATTATRPRPSALTDILTTLDHPQIFGPHFSGASWQPRGTVDRCGTAISVSSAGWCASRNGRLSAIGADSGSRSSASLRANLVSVPGRMAPMMQISAIVRVVLEATAWGAVGATANIVASISLHALARRFQRGFDTTDGAILVELRELAMRHAAIGVSLCDGGSWVGEVARTEVAQVSCPVLAVRTFAQAERERRAGPCRKPTTFPDPRTSLRLQRIPSNATAIRQIDQMISLITRTGPQKRRSRCTSVSMPALNPAQGTNRFVLSHETQRRPHLGWLRVTTDLPARRSSAK